ncbi:MAG: putative small protein [Nitrospirae bacterium]|nr:MAG: putative small protein [Nitrospirota bacterium]
MKVDTTLLKSMKAVGLPESDNVVRESIALFLFQKKLVSIGKAAELANMSLAQFMELLRSLKIPQAEYTEDDLAADMATIKRLRRGKHRN